MTSSTFPFSFTSLTWTETDLQENFLLLTHHHPPSLALLLWIASIQSIQSIHPSAHPRSGFCFRSFPLQLLFFPVG